MAARLTRGRRRTTPDQWAAENRVYPPSAGIPGPRDPWLTPYTIAFARTVAERRYRKVVLAMGAQGGKTDTLLDVIGHRVAERPAPILYVGPNKQFLNEQFEPRLMGLLDEAETVRDLVARGKRMTKTRKVIAGVPLRLAHAGSSTALKSDPAALALTDEADELMANVKGQGDPIGLVDARGDTYADFVHAIVSTPTKGMKDVDRDPKSGLEFWKVQASDDLDSTIWSLWQSGTRYHWAWQCPHCREWFIPRFECLAFEGKGQEMTTTPARGIENEKPVLSLSDQKALRTSTASRSNAQRLRLAIDPTLQMVSFAGRQSSWCCIRAGDEVDCGRRPAARSRRRDRATPSSIATSAICRSTTSIRTGSPRRERSRERPF